MRKLTDSDIFVNELNKNNQITGKVQMIMSSAYGTIFLNDILYPDINRKIVAKKRDKMSLMIGNAINDGTILLAYNTPDKKLTSIVPFITFKQNGKNRVLVNMTEDIVQVSKMPDGSVDYSIDHSINKLYCLLYSAFLAVDRYVDNPVLSPRVALDASILWARMFNNPIYDVVGLYNSDRKTAYMYFSMKFFLIYFLDYKEEQAEHAVKGYIGKKNALIIDMENKLQDRNIDMYHKGIINYLYYLLDNEISNTIGIKVRDLQSSMNVSSYLNKFSGMYSQNALLSLCSYPYFVFVIYSAFTKSGILKDKAFEKNFEENKKVVYEFLTAIKE